MVAAVNRLAEVLNAMDAFVHRGEEQAEVWRELQAELIAAQMGFVNTVDAGQQAGLRCVGWALSPVEVLIEGRQDVVDRAEGDHGGCPARDLAAQGGKGVVRLCGE